MATKEKRFLSALESLFTGAEVEGDSGFVNLMRIKRNYFRSLHPQLMQEIDTRTEQDSDFREELFDKLYTFFNRYFCESGSIYFRHLPAFSKIYARVYADGNDVALSWKTQMLYYVKSDILVRSMPVTLSKDGRPQRTRRFYFDVSEFEHKKNNGRHEYVFTFDAVEQKDEDKVVNLAVSYSQNGNKTQLTEILKAARAGGVSINEGELQKAINVFRRQTEVDYFINKDARGFLREQFDLWVYQYVFEEETIFEEKRIKQLQAIKEIAYYIIDFIAQFEDELCRVWKKPKFVRNVNYVVTLDRLSEKTLRKVIKHSSMKAQVKEWEELGLVEGKFSAATILKGQRELDDKGANGKCKFLPLDTKHFKDMELEILADLGDLHEALDGELVHSENWQVLNTLQQRYKEKIKCIYIDPPFNLDSSDQFDYRTNYKNSCWATVLENRLARARELLSADGCIFVRCGHEGNHILRFILNQVFGEENYRNEIVVRRAEEQKGELMKQFSNMRAMMVNYDVLYWFSTNPGTRFNFITRPIDATQGKSHWHSFWKAEDRKELRYDLLGINLAKTGRGQWMWSKDRAMRAVINYNEYQEKYSSKLSLEEYWREKSAGYYKQHAVPLEFIRRDENGNGNANKNGISSVKYWIPPRTTVVSDNNWMDIRGYSNITGFKTENSEALLRRILSHVVVEGEVSLDFFSGSGTTMSVAQKLGRKWLGVEMGEHFSTVILPRMKKVLGGHQSGISKDVAYKGGGAFKYYSLEQYEEALKNAHYQGGEQLELDSTKSPFEQYVFFSDDKLAYAVQFTQSGKLKINLSGLYPDIDIAESLSNILGKPIRTRTADTVTFTDGTTEKTNPAKMTEKEKQHFISLIKSYLWWGE